MLFNSTSYLQQHSPRVARHSRLYAQECRRQSTRTQCNKKKQPKWRRTSIQSQLELKDLLACIPFSTQVFF